MRYSLSKELISELKKIKRKQPQLLREIRKQLKIFEENPRHTSLKTHKLKGNLRSTWSIFIEENKRMLYFVEDEEAVFFSIGNHDEVYR